jgi:ubiquinone/menaquinone biosynthesis C-methylase UbiE
MSYHQQITEVFAANPENMLEIGIGNGTVTNYLRTNGVKATTLDFARDLNPDVQGGVTNLPFADMAFDTVLCAEVLEHLPFDLFEIAIVELLRVASNRVILTLPHSQLNFGISITTPPMIKDIISVNIPYPKKHVFNGEHYWEIGKKGYSLKSVIKILSDKCILKTHYCFTKHPYIHFFILDRGAES